MIDYETLKARAFAPVEQAYTQRDTILYALGLGLGGDPLDAAHLRATYERAEGFCALPSMVNVLAGPGFWAMEPDTGLTWQKILHGEQSFTLHAPLPAEGTIVGETRITEIIDKGEGKGALIYSERRMTDKATGTLIATVEGTSFARGDGGFGYDPIFIPDGQEPGAERTVGEWSPEEKAAASHRAQAFIALGPLLSAL